MLSFNVCICYARKEKYCDKRVCMSVCLFACLPVCLSVCLSVCVSVCVSQKPHAQPHAQHFRCMLSAAVTRVDPSLAAFGYVLLSVLRHK